MLKERLERLLNYTEELPTTQVVVEFTGKNGVRFEMKSIELGDILRSVLFEVPALRKAFDDARETPSLERSKWEYASVGVDVASDYVALFDRLGDDGWELIHCDFAKGIVVLKRPK